MNHRTINGIPFEVIDWWEDLKAIGDLYRWLVQIGRPPADVPYFIENSREWWRDYETLLQVAENQTPKPEIQYDALRLV